jgi:hypothetical protein
VEVENGFDFLAAPVFTAQRHLRRTFDCKRNRFAVQVSCAEIDVRKHFISFCHLRVLSFALAVPGSAPGALFAFANLVARHARYVVEFVPQDCRKLAVQLTDAPVAPVVAQVPQGNAEHGGGDDVGAVLHAARQRMPAHHDLLRNGLFGVSYRVDQPSSSITLMRLTTASAVRGPQRFSVRHLRRIVREAGKPPDVIGDGDADAPLTEVRDRWPIASRNNAAARIKGKPAQLTPLAEGQNAVVFKRGFYFLVAPTLALLHTHRWVLQRPKKSAAGTSVAVRM